MTAIVILVVIAVVGVAFFGMYNNLVTKNTQVDSAFSNIDVNLKRRADLIPALVETVKGYAEHEKETFDRVTKARQQVVQLSESSTTGELEDANSELSSSLGRLLAISESYPELKADRNFRQLQEELTSTENKIAHARTYYNKIVESYNLLIVKFPSNLLANAFNFEEKPYLEIEVVEREMPEVKF